MNGEAENSAPEADTQAEKGLTKKQIREQRLAAELRANLRRRKAQDRNRRAEDEAPQN